MAVYQRPTYEEILDYLIEQGKALMTKIRNWRVGGVVYSLLATISKGFDRLCEVVDSALNKAFWDTSSGEHLDRIANLVDAPRKAAQKTKGRVIYGRNSSGAAVPIPAGAVVETQTMDDGQTRRYLVIDNGTLSEGELEVEVAVIAQATGGRYNVGAGDIDTMATPITGIDYVRNDQVAFWIDELGADLETDEELRARLPGAWPRLNYPGVKGMYANLAMTHDGVKTAKTVVGLRGEGTVDVIITSDTEDAQPTPTLIAEVQADIDAIKPDEADVLVRGPDAVFEDIEVVITKSLAGGEVKQIAFDVEAAIEDLFLPSTNSRAFGVGDPLNRAYVAYTAMNVPYAANCQVIKPTEDKTIGVDALLRPGPITVHVVGG